LAGSQEVNLISDICKSHLDMFLSVAGALESFSALAHALLEIGVASPFLVSLCSTL
jgi:hypothetical protein